MFCLHPSAPPRSRGIMSSLQQAVSDLRSKRARALSQTLVFTAVLLLQLRSDGGSKAYTHTHTHTHTHTRARQGQLTMLLKKTQFLFFLPFPFPCRRKSVKVFKQKQTCWNKSALSSFKPSSQPLSEEASLCLPEVRGDLGPAVGRDLGPRSASPSSNVLGCVSYACPCLLTVYDPYVIVS